MKRKLVQALTAMLSFLARIPTPPLVALWIIFLIICLFAIGKLIYIIFF